MVAGDRAPRPPAGFLGPPPLSRDITCGTRRCRGRTARRSSCGIRRIDDGPIRERGLIFSPALGSWPMTPCATIPQPTCSGECETLRPCLSIRGLFAGTVICAVVLAGCPELEHRHGEKRTNPNLRSDTRHPIPLTSAGGKEHRAVMMKHIETIHLIMNEMVQQDYESAKGLTE